MNSTNTLPASSVLVTDVNGVSHVVLAAKCIDSFRVLVIHTNHKGEFVVHTFNQQDGGFHNGHYCDTLERAQEVFALASNGVVPYRHRAH